MKTTKKSIWPQLRFFFSFFRPHWKLILISAAGIFISVMMQLPMPLVTRHIIDKVIPGKNVDVLNLISYALLGVIVIQAASSLLTSYISTLFKERVLNNYQARLFGHLLKLDLNFLRKYRSGYLLARVENDVTNLRGLVANNFIYLIKDVLTFITGLCIIFSFNWKLSVASIIVLPFFMYSLKHFSLRLRSRSTDVQQQSAQMFGFLQEALSGVFILKAFQLEKKETGRLEEKQKERLAVNMKYSLTSAVSNNITSFLGAVGPFVVLWYGSYEVMTGRMSLGTLIAFNSFLGYLYGPTRHFMNINEQIQDALASLERTWEIFSTPAELGSGEERCHLSKAQGVITFQDVSFSYADGRPVLTHIDFTAQPGRITALIGKSGAGKTTLVNLIFRFFNPDSGKILLDGQDIARINLEDYRSCIGLVPQEAFLFSGTIRENIRYGRPDASEAEILEAMRLAHVDEFVERLPEGIETMVGERGAQLSGGQRQRIALARVILRDAKILILDEPTSELDALSEKFIQDALIKISGNRTTFVIAHRLSTVRDAHQVLFLENGLLQGIGTHASLFEESEPYREIYRAQYGDADPGHEFCAKGA